MNISFPTTAKRSGATLVEAVIAVGVLAIAIPLVFGTIAESGKSGMSAQAETRSTWMIPVCMQEIQDSRNGKPRYFTATTTGQAFPPAGQIWALAFNQEGRPVGKISSAEYDKGLKSLNGQPVRYVATMAATQVPPEPAQRNMLRVDIFIEYPSASPSKKRQKFAFHTRIP